MYSKNKGWGILILFALFLIIPCAFSFGQSTYGTIKGVVLDGEKEPLAGANILLPNLERGASTDHQGGFTIAQLPAGTYKVVVDFIGYASQMQTINVKADETSRIHFTLHQSVFETEPIVITGSPIAVDPLHSPQDISSISGREKIRLQSTSLGKTIESIPGIYNMSAGSVAGKPIIRGQTGERIRILSDGVAQEYQQYGERHAPNIDPFNAERLEIIKGAASLLYGSDALGGAINVIPYRFHIASVERTEFSGSFTTTYNTNNNEFMAGTRFGVSKGNIGLRGALVRRRAGNFHTPEIDPFPQTGSRGDPKFTGEIDHTDFEQINGSFSTGILTQMGLFSIHYDHYYNENNFLLPPGSPIGLRLQNQIVTAKANVPLGRFILRPKLSYQRNHRRAAKPGQSRDVLPDSANVDLLLDVYTGRIEVEHTNLLDFSGTLGAEVKYYDHENIGLVPLQPSGHFGNFALFGFEEWQSDPLTLNFGIRFDYRSQEFMGSPTNPLLPQDDSRTFSSLSGAVGASYRLSDVLTAAANVGRGFRTPSFYNMYVYGYHGGVFAYQIGNPELDNETSIDMSASLRLRHERVNASATVFQNRIDNYIFLYNAPDHPLAPQNETFVFAHDQAKAILTGLDLGIRYTPFDWLVLGGTLSFIDSEFSSGTHRENELPLMPADRVSGNMKFLLADLYALKSPYVFLNVKAVGEKSAAGIYEPFGQFDDGIGPDIPFGVASTEAYSLVNIGFGFDLNVMNRSVNFDVEITNVLDREYRDFLDTYKGYALSPGQGVDLKLNVPFGR
jgi:iron complex outermembrane receptor protein/hemoglobin/transferrin/lactoferrin receptor protein